jgi:hypothetical protein
MRLTQLRLPVEGFSATSLAKAIQCPEAWRHKYLLQDPEPFGTEKFMGSVDHKTFEAFYKDHVSSGLWWSLEQTLNAFRYLWYDDEDTPADFDETGSLYEKGELMVTRYYEDVAQTIEPFQIEQRFEERIPGVDLPLRGYIDLETADRIVERKTTGTKVSKPKATWRLQGRIYQLVSRKPIEWHVTTRQARPQVVTGIMLPAPEPAEVDVTVKVIRQTINNLNDLYLRYGSTQPWPTTGLFHEWACSYCAFINRCPAWAHHD